MKKRRQENDKLQTPANYLNLTGKEHILSERVFVGSKGKSTFRAFLGLLEVVREGQVLSAEFMEWLSSSGSIEADPGTGCVPCFGSFEVVFGF